MYKKPNIAQRPSPTNIELKKIGPGKMHNTVKIHIIAIVLNKEYFLRQQLFNVIKLKTKTSIIGKVYISHIA